MRRQEWEIAAREISPNSSEVLSPQSLAIFLFFLFSGALSGLFATARGVWRPASGWWTVDGEWDQRTPPPPGAGRQRGRGRAEKRLGQIRKAEDHSSSAPPSLRFLRQTAVIQVAVDNAQQVGDLFTAGFMFENCGKSDQRKRTRYAELPSDFVQFASDPASRDKARHLLIAKYSRPSERIALYELIGLPIPSAIEIEQNAAYNSAEDAMQVGREAKFRIHILAAYDYTCALTGYRLA